MIRMKLFNLFKVLYSSSLTGICLGIFDSASNMRLWVNANLKVALNDGSSYPGHMRRKNVGCMCVARKYLTKITFNLCE